MEVSSVSFALCNDFWDGLFLITHRFDIKVQTARGVIDTFDQADCFSGSVKEISFCSGEGFHGKCHSERSGNFGDFMQGLGGS